MKGGGGLADQALVFLFGGGLNAAGDFQVRVEKDVAFLGQAAAVGSVAIEQLDAER